MAKSLKDHWDKKYADTPITQLGWFETKSIPSVQLIENCGVSKDAPIADIGSGTSTLIANLLDLGYQNIFAIDISSVALEKAKVLLPPEQAIQVHWVLDDITHPASMLQLPKIAVWHDRAVFHFLTGEQDRQTYRSLVEQILMPGGFVVIATFAVEGAAYCSGLPVRRYNVDRLREFFSEGYKLVESLDYMYKMPSGDIRPYVYARFQKG
jgi:SAM-dependent methyltransferase